jgi:hypothetical protein
MRAVRTIFLYVILLYNIAPSYASQINSDAVSIDLSFEFNWENSKSVDSSSQQKRVETLLAEGQLSYPLLFHDRQFVGVVPSRVRLMNPYETTKFEVGLSQFLERPLYDISLTSKGSNIYQINITYPVLVIDKYGKSLNIDGLTTYEGTVKENEHVFQVELPIEPYVAMADFAQSDIEKKTNATSIPVRHYWDTKGFYLPPVVWHSGLWSTGALVDSNQSDVDGMLRVYSRNTKGGWAEQVSSLAAVRTVCSACPEPVETSLFNPSSWLGIPPRERLYLATTPPDAEIILSGSRLPEKTDNEVPVPRGDWPTIVLHKAQVGDCRVEMGAIVAPVSADDPFRFSCTLGPTILESRRK